MQKRPVEIIMSRSCPFSSKARCRSSTCSTRHMTIDHQQCAGLSPMCDAINHQWTTIYKTIIANLSPTCCSEYDADERCVPPPVLKCARNKDWCDDTNIQIRQRKLFCCLTNKKTIDCNTVNRTIFWCGQSSATGVTPVASYEAMANVIFYEVTELQNVLSMF